MALPHPEHAVSLGPAAWALLLSRAILITGSLVYKATRALVSPKQRNGRSFYEYLAYEGLGDYQCGLSAVRIQNLLPTTSKKCLRFAKAHNLDYAKIPILDDKTIALWLGPRKPAKLVVHFHGGGYACPALGAQINMAFGFRPRPDVAVVVLQYALASEKANHYPYQLQQAAALLQHILHTELIPASAITLVGDSAGGHLLLGLLMHINHPNPAVPPVTVGENKFAGAALISPRIEIESNLLLESSATKPRDIIRPASLEYWGRNFLGGAPRDPWNNVLSAPAEWWADLPVDDLLVTFGECELFRDDIARLCEVVKESTHYTGKITAVEGAGELHEHMVMNRFLGMNRACETETAYVEWFEQRVGTRS
ncbi:Alpha/Beta hydrolase protein [Apodospora peruviana]|uniref:Alpha/Beta hydrolase protein n=1 Tax=Apodospora peruviana TaxID=516989 RepID=A0AAE0IH15_9PEZI|nr:Alpha/Beta hydrolase protein [Apodospora peruviana]